MREKGGREHLGHTGCRPASHEFSTPAAHGTTKQIGQRARDAPLSPPLLLLLLLLLPFFTPVRLVVDVVVVVTTGGAIQAVEKRVPPFLCARALPRPLAGPHTRGGGGRLAPPPRPFPSPMPFSVHAAPSHTASTAAGRRHRQALPRLPRLVLFVLWRKEQDGLGTGEGGGEEPRLGPYRRQERIVCRLPSPSPAHFFHAPHHIILIHRDVHGRVTRSCFSYLFSSFSFRWLVLLGLPIG